MATRVTPPPLQGPTAKEKKYDRQLRLWAASGQQALEEAHILLINGGSGVVGVETLKNLVLPGVSNFTIVDENLVVEEDLGVNFFLDDDSLGKSRAEECCKFLSELNPEVNGHAVHMFPDIFLDSFDTDLSKYTLILITAPARLKTVVQKASTFAAEHSIPLFYVHSVGFYSHFSIQLPWSFPIVDTHPDPVSTQDLRLLRPWPELLEHMKSKTSGLESMSDHDHGHTAYLILLLYYLEEWKASHDGKYPESYKDKTAFRGTVQAAARSNNAEGGEENYGEAVAAVLKSLNPPSIPSGLREIFKEPECKELSKKSANFWLIAHSLEAFIALNGALPLPGALPDMKAQSSDYITLQNIYRTKAQKDLASVTSKVRELEEQLGRTHAVESKEIEAFCKGAAFVKLVHGRTLRIPTSPGNMDWEGREEVVARELGDSESLISIYIAVMALDVAIDKLAVPGSDSLIQVCDQDDFSSLRDIALDHILEPLKSVDPGLDVKSTKEHIQKIFEEIKRTGPFELHNISSLTGGMVSQEIIKVITKQYIPVDNTCVFDGITSKSAVFRL